MSSIPAKNIDGDISIGRNANIGSNAIVRGSATVGHNLKVEGWLDAPNVKGTCKGFYLDTTDLNAAYPTPTDGDYAFVGAGLPAPIYIAKNGAWIDSGEEGGPEIDINGVTEKVAEFAGSIDAIDKAQEKLRGDFDTHITSAATELAAVKATAEAAATNATEAKGQATAAVSTANEAKTVANEAKTDAEAASDKANEAKAAADNAGTTAAAAAKSAAAAAETAAGAVTAINTLKTENTADHAAIREELTDAVTTEAEARKAVSDALAAHETADAKEHAAIRKEMSDAREDDKSEQHNALSVSGIVAFDGFVGDVSDDVIENAAPIVRDPKGKVSQGAATVHFSTADGCFYIKQDGKYYPNWDDAYLWQDAQQVPWADKAYYNIADGRLYRYSVADAQLREIALTKLSNGIGILPCRVRQAAPLMLMEGAPQGTITAYTIWWSQANAEFYAATGYDEAVSGDSIENCDSYQLKYFDEYRDYCEVTGSGETQTVTPRNDRIYRSGNALWRYDKTTGKMVEIGDVTGADLSIGTLECGDATLQGDVEITGLLEVGNRLTVSYSDLYVVGGDLHVQGSAEFGEVSCSGAVSGYVVHGDSATFCQGEEVKIDVDGNISTEGNITAGGSVKTSEIVPGSGSGGILEVDGQLVTKNWGVIANGDSNVNGQLSVSTAVSADELHADSKIVLDKEDVGAMLVHIFHGIRQSLPSDYTAATMALTPKTRTDGVADIIYVREKKRFYAFWDEQKAYAERFDGDGEYNVITNNKPTTARTDRTWRWNADTYKYDTEAYISQYIGKDKDTYGADLVCVTDAGKALFIKMWREALYRPMVGGGKAGYISDAGAEQTAWLGACDDLGNCYVNNSSKFQVDYGGYYPEWHETPGFFINGITGISYAEARQIFEVRTFGAYPRFISDAGTIRTNMLCCYDYSCGGGQDGRGINTPFVFQSYDAQVIRVGGGLRGQRPVGGACWLRGALNFYNADKLEEVIGAVQIGTLGDTAFNNIFSPFRSKLQYLWIMDLSVSLTKTFAMASAINVDCLRYLVEKSRATAAKPISVTLHADVFAALPEDILTLAETKYVTFVSA